MSKGRFVLVMSILAVVLATAVPVLAAEVQGQVQAVSGDMIKLADGTTLTIPKGAQVDRNLLKPGASVKASFEEQGGQKVLTNLTIMPAAAPAAPTAPAAPGAAPKQ